jgi:enoyl-CoA hydratase/carnithine racemase
MTAGDESPLTPPAVCGDDRPVSPCVNYERRGHVLVIRMEREAKRNAIDKAMTHGIDEALNLLDDDDELWAGVITGTTTVFSAGTDLKDGSGRTERGGEYGMIRRRRATPLIAAVEGPAFGPRGGLPRRWPAAA